MTLELLSPMPEATKSVCVCGGRGYANKVVFLKTNSHCCGGSHVGEQQESVKKLGEIPRWVVVTDYYQK